MRARGSNHFHCAKGAKTSSWDRGANMRKIMILGLAILTALSIAGCAGKGKVPLGKGKGKTPIHTRG